MIILGVDPSSTCTGYGVLEYASRVCRYVTCGCIRPPRGTAFEDRLVVMFTRLRGLIDEHRPAEAAVELTFFGKDPDAAAKLGHARGVLLLALRLANVTTASYTPAEVKRAVTGSGRASKQQVQLGTAKLLGLGDLPRPHDAADALAIALCHSFRPGALVTGAVPGRRPEVDALLRRMIRR
jgi:crossover junction endodeoxyribonuclease RuvC